MPMLMDDAAYAARLWHNGRRQKDIGAMLGHANSTSVSIGIKAFLGKYAKKFDANDYDLDRRKHVPAALAEFKREKGYIPNNFVSEAKPEKERTPWVNDLIARIAELSRDDRLGMKLEDLPFSTRVRWALVANEGLTTIGELRDKTDQELMRIPNFGKKCLSDVKEMLSLLDVIEEPPELAEELEVERGPSLMDRLDILEAKLDAIIGLLLDKQP